MRTALVLLLCLPAAARAAAAGDRVSRLERRVAAVEGRVGTLEERVTGVEERVARLEESRTTSPQRAPDGASGGRELPAEPIAVTFLKKEELIGQERAGIRLQLEFRNLAGRDLVAFSGMLVFRNEKGAVIWTKPFAYSEPFAAGRRLRAAVGLLSNEPKAYLKFVKAKAVTVTFVRQEVYGE